MKRQYTVRWLVLGVVIALGVGGCQQNIASAPTPLSTPERTLIAAATTTPIPTLPPPTTTSRPMVTPTLTATSTLLPAPTATSSPTTTPTPDIPHPLLFDFADKGKIMPLGESGSWDDFALWAPDVLFYEGQFHMFYTGFSNAQFNNSTIGYATSPDGITWSKYTNNPILVGNEQFPKIQAPAILVENGQWVMYLDGGKNGEPLGQYILRATAPSPTGPWQLDAEPVISGVVRTWDRAQQPVTILHTENGYYLYYNGVGAPGPQMGLAFSDDGIHFTFYNDPATTEFMFERSDPILAVGPEGSWDMGGVASYQIIHQDGLWEMFYIGFPVDPFKATTQDYPEPLAIGYATSADGLHWEKYPGNPAFSSYENRWPLIDAIKVGDVYYIYYDINGGPGGLGLLQGTITPLE